MSNTKLFGYTGRNLHVDLTSEMSENKDLDLEMAKKFIGGLGVALRLAYEYLKPRTDPLSPSNVFVLGVGPLSGPFPLAIRSSLVTREPITGAVAFNSCGTMFGRRIKAAGYDNLIVNGRAEEPVYLRILDDDVELLDASHLWGKDTWETTEELWKIHGRECSVISIGQAGENLAALALAFVDNLSHLGKGGLGAVMGSKNLKAIVVGGTKKVAVFDEKRLRELSTSVMTNVRRNYYLHDAHLELVHQYMEPFVEYFTRLYRNRTEVFPSMMFMEGAMGTMPWRRKLSEKMIGHMRLGCPGCPVPCKNRWEIKEGKYKGTVLQINGGGTYKGSPGPGKTGEINVRCAPDADVEETIYLLNLCNRYGVCVQVFAPTMDLAIDLYDRGIISNDDTGHTDLKRDFETTLRLVKQVAFKEGFGKVLANGSAGLAKRFPEAAKYSMDIKGVDTQFDPRCLGLDPAKFGQLTNPEGGAIEPTYSARGLYTYNELKAYCESLAVPENTEEKILNEPVKNLTKLTPYTENFHGLLSSLDICEYYKVFFDYSTLAEIYTAVTGIKATPKMMGEAAERIWNLYKIINVREGFSRKNDRPPARWFEPYKDEMGEMITLVNAPIGGAKPTVLKPDDLERMLDSYYDERGWDVRTGIPTEKKLVNLGLQFALEDLKIFGS